MDYYTAQIVFLGGGIYVILAFFFGLASWSGPTGEMLKRDPCERFLHAFYCGLLLLPTIIVRAFFLVVENIRAKKMAKIHQ